MKSAIAHIGSGYERLSKFEPESMEYIEQKVCEFVEQCGIEETDGKWFITGVSGDTAEVCVHWHGVVIMFKFNTYRKFISYIKIDGKRFEHYDDVLDRIAEIKSE